MYAYEGVALCVETGGLPQVHQCLPLHCRGRILKEPQVHGVNEAVSVLGTTAPGLYMRAEEEGAEEGRGAEEESLGPKASTTRSSPVPTAALSSSQPYFRARHSSAHL